MNRSAVSADPDWWRDAVVYQVYPRSFRDADGDGLGDIAGIIEKVDHLAGLGVDAVWLSPFYPSALADGGYDVDDHRAVDPRLGTLADVADLVAALHSHGIRLIVDIVPNHSSDRHEWFREALASPPGSAARARYIFRDGRGPGGDLPPSDWPSRFGGAAWTRVITDGRPEQWYMHLFSHHQPDFDWTNEDVREDFRRTLRFWADLGVDGFRIDVAHALTKDLSEPLRSKPVIIDFDNPDSGDDVLFDRNEVHEIYRDWRTIFDGYDPPRIAVAEAAVNAKRRPLYCRPDELHQAFNFDLLHAPYDATRFRRIIEENLAIAAETGTSSTWVLGNHDIVRHATRYGLPTDTSLEAWLMTGGTEPELDRARGLRRARAATLLMLALPGSAYLYQGEELGLHEVADLPLDVLQDPIHVRTDGAEKGRDGCRVPVPWTTHPPHFGFTAATPQLPMPPDFGAVSVQAQKADPTSTLSMYRKALALRSELRGSGLASPALEWHETERPANLLHFTRGEWGCVMNFGLEDVPLPSRDILISSSPLAGAALLGDTTVWYRVTEGA
ncbi:glycoside hydrolase family 13 protein [Microbacterium lacus]|uniref:Glycoside hydrolase family 13 protein n=1 Tax=Microbacterium lacus TaxID=415217 RepID=A0ABN2HBB3_9MICO